MDLQDCEEGCDDEPELDKDEEFEGLVHLSDGGKMKSR